MTQEYKSFMTEGYSIGAHAESLYSRGYKHYGTMGQGNKQVHIFTPSKGKVDHHMLLRHDGADPARHEGQPDLKKIKGMTEMVETTDVIAIQKARETKAQRQDRNVQEETPEENVKRMKLLARIRKNLDRQISGDDEDWPAKRRKVDSAREASRNAQMKKMNEANLEEGWLFGSRYKQIGNKYATHRVTVKHLPTNTKHTFDVTAPTDRHAFDHVDRHMHGGRRGNTLSLVKIQHLHEGKEVMTEALDIRHAINHPDTQARHHARKFRDHSKTANDIANMRVFPDQAYDYAHHYETAQHHAKEYKKRLGQLEAGKNEDLQEVSKELKNRYLDKAVERQGKDFRKPVDPKNLTPKGRRLKKSWTDSDEYKNKQKKFEKRRSIIQKVSQEVRGKKQYWDMGVKNEDLQELSKNTLQSYLARAKGDRNKADLKRSVASHEWDKGFNKEFDSRGGFVSSIPTPSMKKHMGDIVSQSARIDKRTKGIAAARARLTKEGLDEGLLSRITNAAKNLNKRLTPSSERIAKTREKVGYDNAKGTDLRPRGKALRSVERIEWSKQNPKKKLKDIVPMGKLPDKLWSADSDKPKPKRVTDDSLDRPMFRKAGALSRRFKTEDLEEDRNKFKNDHDGEVSKNIAKHGEPSSKKHSYDSMSDHHVTELGYPKKTVSIVTKRYKGGRLASHNDLTADSAHSVFVQNMKSEELEIRPGQKVLKEKPKRDPKTGRLAKSKVAQKVEDCIKMSGKKEKIDTEPSYNPLTTAGGGGTPNA